MGGLGYGPLEADPNGIFDLPAGFSYRVISRVGDLMSDGLLVPGAPDAMGAFPGPDGRVIVVRNHELVAVDTAVGPFGQDNELLTAALRARLYDGGAGKTPSQGGTTTMVYDPASGRVEKQFLSLAGTDRNCAGGPTPWGSWVSCEEYVEGAGVHEYHQGGGDGSVLYRHERDHGYNFEVPARANPSTSRPVALRAMGRFNHEAIAVDPRTGIVYQTEDRPDSLVYRFIPDHRGELHRGGRLQALAFIGQPSRDTRNWSDQFRAEAAGTNVESLPPAQPALELEQPHAVEWIDLNRIDAPGDDLRLRGIARGAACFARGEGMWWGNDELYFACTYGGPLTAGQVFRYKPGPKEGTSAEREQPGQLELFVESHDRKVLSNVDNITVSPWGDIVACEDTAGTCALAGITPGGELYRIGNNPYTSSELAGACFSPDGSTLFVNIQANHMTLAITGPWV